MDLDDLWDENPKKKAGVKPEAKKPVKKEEYDDWGGFGNDDPPVKQKTPVNNQPFGFGGATGLRKMKADEEDDEWGLDKEPASKSQGGRLLGRKSNIKSNDDDDDDLFDGMLDALEAKRGIENTKALEEVPAPTRPKTAAARNSSWGAAPTNDLDDLDDLGETVSQRGANEALAAKRRSLFGGGAQAQKEGGARASTAPNHPPIQSKQPSFGMQGVLGGSADQADFPGLVEANASVGSHGSGIEVIEVPNSRQRRMIRPPTAQGKPPNPPGNLNQIQELHQNNRLTRPGTGTVSKSRPFGVNPNTTDDGDVLNLLDESQNAASIATSIGNRPNSVKQNQQAFQQFQATGSNVDFDRAEESEYEYYEESQSESDKRADPDDSDDDGGGFYQPTLMAKISKPKAMKKKKKKVKKQQLQFQPLAAPIAGMSQGGSGAGFDFNDSVKKGNTIGSDGGFVMHVNPPPRGATAKFPNMESNPIKQRPNDTKGQLKFDIEEERLQIQKMEERYREDLEKVRKENSQTISDIEKRFIETKKSYEEEKIKVQEDKSTALEQDKKKQMQLNSIDIENREMKYTKSLQNQRQLFEEQQQNLRKQLQERVQINDLAQQISQSSGNINSLVAKIGATNEGNLQRREDDISRKEKEVDEKRRQIAERKMAIEQRKRKLQQEIEEIKSRENETKHDYQREKSEITADLDKIEMDHLKDVRLIRDKVIECEVETRKIRQEVEKVHSQIEKEEVAHKDKLDDFTIEKKQIIQGSVNFKADSSAQERELRSKLQAANDTMKEVVKQGIEFDRKQMTFDDTHNRIISENDNLQEELDKYCIEKDQFDRSAQNIKEKGEQDQIDSEKIGYFKANKNRLNEELKQLRVDLEAEKQMIREDKIEMEIFKNELKTKQKTIENMRYNYIKGDQQSLVQRAEYIANAKGPTLPQRTTEVNSYPQINFLNKSVQEPPRFNYDQYMKGLTDKISGAAPNANSYIGADFQAYLLRERESYQKSVHDFSKDTPLIQSLAKLRTGNQMKESSPDMGMRSNGTGSLHYMSRGGFSDD